MKKINAVLLLVILSLSLIVGPLSMLAEENGDVLAIVNGVVITKAQFYELLETEYGYYALQELVQKELVRQRPMPCRSVSMKRNSLKSTVPSLRSLAEPGLADVFDPEQCDRRDFH